jgi:hypothetical protein
VLSVDEKPHIQALEPAQGWLKLPNGKAITGFNHEFKRAEELAADGDLASVAVGLHLDMSASPTAYNLTRWGLSPPNPRLVAPGAYDLKDREIAEEVDAIACATSVRREGGLLIVEAERNDLQPASWSFATCAFSPLSQAAVHGPFLTRAVETSDGSIHSVASFIGSPRSTIVFAVLVIHERLPGNDTIIVAAGWTVLLSVVAHGVTANPLVKNMAVRSAELAA